MKAGQGWSGLVCGLCMVLSNSLRGGVQAALMTHHKTVRQQFERLAFVVLGMKPEILAVQRQLYLHITGDPMEVEPDATVSLRHLHCLNTELRLANSMQQTVYSKWYTLSVM